MNPAGWSRIQGCVCNEKSHEPCRVVKDSRLHVQRDSVADGSRGKTDRTVKEKVVAREMAHDESCQVSKDFASERFGNVNTFELPDGNFTTAFLNYQKCI